jgi:hypothetical protein
LSLPCSSCFEGKRTRAPFRTSYAPIPSDLSRNSTDICGTLLVSPQGARYLKVAVDDKSQSSAGILLSKTSEAPSHLSALLRAWATITGLPVKIFISDKDKKNSCTRTFKRFMKKRNNPPYNCPLLFLPNGHAERAVRTIQNAVRAALSHSQIPPRHWHYAALDAITKGNTQPSPLTKDVSYNTFHKSPISTVNLYLPSDNGAMSRTPSLTKPLLICEHSFALPDGTQATPPRSSGLHDVQVTIFIFKEFHPKTRYQPLYTHTTPLYLPSTWPGPSATHSPAGHAPS